MSTNLLQTVFDSLLADTIELEKLKAEYASTEKKIKSKRYSEQTLQKEVYPKHNALRRQIRDDGARAIDKAHKLVDQYLDEVEHLNDLDPSAITDDIKLFTAGVKLLPRDIYAIIERNPDNRTMTQLALRYAQEHDIKMDVRYVGTEAEKRNATDANVVIDYYGKWICEDNAMSMLYKFFSVEE